MFIKQSEMDTLWANVFARGKEIRQNKEDGRKGWEDLSAELQRKISGIKFSWNSKCLKFYVQMISELKLIESDKEISHQEWEKHHFLLQHGRIPHKNQEQPELIKLFQVAYNAGQFSSLIGDELYTKHGRLQYYIENDLGNIETYCDRKQLDLIIV